MTVTPRAPFTRPVPGLAVSIDTGDGIDTLILRGQADVDTVPVLADMLARVLVLHDTSVVVDLSDTEVMDAAAAQVLAHTAEFLNDRGRHLTLRLPLERLVPMLDDHGLSQTIERTDSARP